MNQEAGRKERFWRAQGTPELEEQSLHNDIAEILIRKEHEDFEGLVEIYDETLRLRSDYDQLVEDLRAGTFEKDAEKLTERYPLPGLAGIEAGDETPPERIEVASSQKFLVLYEGEFLAFIGDGVVFKPHGLLKVIKKEGTKMNQQKRQKKGNRIEIREGRHVPGAWGNEPLTKREELREDEIVYHFSEGSIQVFRPGFLCTFIDPRGYGHCYAIIIPKGAVVSYHGQEEIRIEIDEKTKIFYAGHRELVEKEWISPDRYRAIIEEDLLSEEEIKKL